MSWIPCRWVAVIIVVCPRVVFSAEVVLKSGDAFVGEIVRETEKETLFSWNGETYSIPRRDIARVDHGKSGKHVSYRHSTFLMKDGSRIRGVVAEESQQAITVRTEMGFLTLERSNIQSTDHQPGRRVSLPDSYRKRPADVPATYLGFGPAVFANGPPVGRAHPVSFGFEAFVEPAFLEWRSYRFGYLGEYLESTGQVGRYRILGNIVYASWKPSLRFLDNLYARAGAGILQVSFREGEETRTGLDPVFLGELGRLQNLGRFPVAIGARISCAVESGALPCMVGFVFAMRLSL